MAARSAALVLCSLFAGCGQGAPGGLGRLGQALPQDPGACLVLGAEVLQPYVAGQGCRTTKRATLMNGCEEPVWLTSVRVEPSGAFSLVQAPALPDDGGLRLPSGREVTVGVLFGPDQAGALVGELVVEVESGAAASERRWQLEGESLPAELATEEVRFDYPWIRPADLLFVIDNGWSLEGHLESLRLNLSYFAKYADASERDLGIGLVTVAGSGQAGPGEVLPTADGRTVLWAQDPGFEEDFNGIVAGLEVRASAHDLVATAAEALEAASGFPRPRVETSVVLIGPGPDLSPDSPYDSLARMRWATGWDRWTWGFSIHAVAPFRMSGGCSEATDDGTLQTLVMLTNGVSEDLCTPDWSKTLELGNIHKFPGLFIASLGGEPTLTRGIPLKVSVDGVEVPEFDRRGGRIWTYDGQARAVVFQPLYLPAPDQVTKVTYPLACPAM